MQLSKLQLVQMALHCNSVIPVHTLYTSISSMEAIISFLVPLFGIVWNLMPPENLCINKYLTAKYAITHVKAKAFFLTYFSNVTMLHNTHASNNVSPQLGNLYVDY